MGHLSLISSKDWKDFENFIPRKQIIRTLGVTLLGYFPYHTARIIPEELLGKIRPSILQLPRKFFHQIEYLLTITKINDNKAVYIFESNDLLYNFALMFKDDYVILGSWDEVVRYDHKPLIKISHETNI